MGKTSRHFRLDDEVYEVAQERAKREYTNVTAIVERFLAQYAGLMGSDENVDVDTSPQYWPRQPVVGYSKERQARGRRRPG